MGKIYESVTEMIGGTPLLRLHNIEKELGLQSEVVAKLEYFNPGGSAKDRIGLAMILDAEKNGRIGAGATVIEPTSGNTGIGLSLVCAAKGYRAMIVMPDTMSIERIKLMKAYGAEVILTPGKEGMAGAIAKAEALQAETPNSIIAGQFANPANPKAHYDTTGPEIWKDTDGCLDWFVAGIGTGGTLSGSGKYLKEQAPGIKVAGIEPADSPLISQGKAGPHTLQGIGANFIPEALDRTVYDEILTVTGDDALCTLRLLAAKEGIFTGITSGAALWAACQIAKREAGKRIVVLLPDTGERYLSALEF